MKKTNFRCPQTGEEFFISRFVIMKGKYYEKIGNNIGKELVNSDGVPLELIEIEVDWSDGKLPHIGTGKGSAGKQKLQKMLKKRSNLHFQKEVKSERNRKVNHFDKTGQQS